jgi:uncharacterized membrane protein
LKKAIAFAVILPAISAVGAYFVSGITPYLVIAALLTVLILSWYSKLDKRYLAIYVWGLSASILLGTSMIGQHIVGNDIHGEYFVSYQNMLTGWNLDYTNTNNTSLAVALVAPLLGKAGFNIIWQYKLLYPLIYSFTPVLLYFGYKKLFGERLALTACLLLIAMPMFTLDMTSHVKGLVAQTFLAGLIPLTVCEMKTWQRITGIAICIIGATVNHYTVATILMMYLAGTGIILLVAKWAWVKRIIGEQKIKVKYLALPVMVGVIVMAGYYSIAGNGGVLRTLARVGNNITNAATSTLTGKEIVTQPAYDKRTQPVEVTGTYLDKQEQSIRTALGLDFFEATTEGKIFRVLQFKTQIGIALGAIIVVFKRKEVMAEYKALIITGFGILVTCLFIPYVSTTVSATRFYWIALYVLSPMLIIGLSTIIKNKHVVLGIIVGYMLFTIGAVFELTKTTKIDTVNIPYSLALSDKRLNINGIFTESDIAAAKWLAYKADKGLSKISDYNGLQLTSEYNPIGLTISPPKGKMHYLLVLSWNAKNKQMVYAKVPGLRMYEELVIPQDALVAYKNEDSTVYLIQR